MINRVTLALVFTSSFLVFMSSEVSLTLQLLPLGLFAVLVFFNVLNSESVLDTFGSLFDLDGLIFVLFLSAFIVGPSLASGYEKSPGFSLFLGLYLILARLYMSVVPISEVLEAYFWSGLLSIGIFVPLSLASFVQSMENLGRFSPFGFHPNLLAFLLAGYFCAIGWKFLTGDWRMKILTGPAGVACLIIIFFASSRGSIVSLLAAGLFASVIQIADAEKKARKKIVRRGLLMAVAILGLALTVQNLAWAQDSFAFVDQILQLSNTDRGFGSGWTGRIDTWRTTVRQVLSDGTWMVGRGVRSSDGLSEGNWIDNGYLVVLYETGIISLCLIVGRFLGILRRFVSSYLKSTSKVQQGLSMICVVLIVVFLTNDIFARYLFSVGNPYSILTLLLFATPTSRLCSCSVSQTVRVGSSPNVLGSANI